MKILISIILFHLISCDSKNSQITPQYYIDSINIENTSNNAIFILANNWIVLDDSTRKNRDIDNIWSTEFLINKLYFSEDEYKFLNTEIRGNDLKSALFEVPMFYRIQPNSNFIIKITINKKILDRNINYFNYHIYYFDDITILNKLSEYNMRNADSLSIKFEKQVLGFSKSLDTISFEDKQFLETSKHLDIIGSKIIH
ncbi:MAG: hypothetical protein WC121_06685 [Candidatus Kapaibacterium sp.]